MSAFREPRHIECMPRGDERFFIWVMEPTLGRIFGKAYSVSNTEIERHGEAILETRKKEAYDEMINRSGRDECVIPEGSSWEAFV